MHYSEIDFNSKTILITGGAGFIGSNLAFYIQEHFPESKIVIFDCFQDEKVLENGNLKSYGHYQNLINFTGNVICGDITDKDDLKKLNEFKFDYIFHHAAISDTRLYNQELVMRTNVNAFYDILEITKRHSSTLVYASSAATYGSSSSPQIIGIEKPENPYGFSKYMMDCIANNFCKKNPSLSITGLRFFNVYGPREFYKQKTSSMVLQFGHQILDGKAPKLFANSDKIFRDFIYIDDVIQANIKACSRNRNSSQNIYNIGTGISRSFQDVADILQETLETNLGSNYIANPFSGYQVDTKADIENTKKDLNFNPIFTLEEGIEAYISDIKRLHGISFYG
jgi:ADP-L-glycero-D-manno-heptose 6-epimerase